jgi:hypothetical protein
MKKNVVSIKKKSGDDIVTDLIQNLMEAHIKEWEANSGEEFNPVIGLYDEVYWLVFIHLSGVPKKYTARAIGIINDAIGTAARNVTDCQNDPDEEDND